jgi:hypothetical protein
MKWFLLPLCLLVLTACKRETTTLSTGGLVLQGTVGDTPVSLEASAKAQTHTTEETHAPPALGEGLSIGGRLLSFAGSSGLLGPWGTVASLGGLALTAAAGYFATKKKDKQLRQVVSGVEDYKQGLERDEADALHASLGRHMDRSAKNAVRKHRGR